MPWAYHSGFTEIWYSELKSFAPCPNATSAARKGVTLKRHTINTRGLINTTLRNQHQALLSIPRHRTSFTVSVCRLCNVLPRHVRDCRTVNQFKLRITYFYMELFDLVKNMEGVIVSREEMILRDMLLELNNGCDAVWDEDKCKQDEDHGHRKISKEARYSLTTPYHSIPKHRTSFYSSSFTVSAAHLWNSLPKHVRDCRTLSSFKNKLKLHFLN
ncbi:hypothetical protein ANN_15573 [Periplaneta americana]|uniref:Uncharacterized protein n=1 Tax=Periplaneta americana TaxID=6978 RepID=A0ABQ8SGQ7_PERAM|nr:hypothetical protein ANN_15573 [Periplaneta americana]